MFTVTVTWNGTTITGPVLIFQDELVRDDRNDVHTPPRNGTVICRSDRQSQVFWQYASGDLVSTISTTDHFRQRRPPSSPQSVSRLTTNRPDEANISTQANGLWSCRPPTASVRGAVPVGIYARGGGENIYDL